MKRFILLINILNYVLCDFMEHLLTAIRFIYVPYWLHVIARRKNWRKTERSLRWLTWDLDVSGPQRKSVRYSNMKDINNDYVIGVIGTVIAPISIFLSIVTKSVFNIKGYGFFLFAIWLFLIYALLNACLSYKKGSWRYIRVFEKRYKHHLPKWRWYTIIFFIAEIAVAVLALTISQ